MGSLGQGIFSNVERDECSLGMTTDGSLTSLTIIPDIQWVSTKRLRLRRPEKQKRGTPGHWEDFFFISVNIVFKVQIVVAKSVDVEAVTSEDPKRNSAHTLKY